MKIVGNTVGTTLDPEKYGVSGEDGATFIPSVDADGNLSWSNDKELENPAPVNIKGPKGEHGVDGKDGASGVYILADGETIEDAPEDADVVIDPSGEGDSTLPNPHALTFTGAVSATYDGSKAVEVKIPSGGGAGGLKLAASVTTSENVASVEISGLELSLPLSFRIYNPGTSCGGGMCITVNGETKNGYTGTVTGEGTELSRVNGWLYEKGGAMAGKCFMSNEGVNTFLWSGLPEVIESIELKPYYNDGTTKYFQSGTVVELYEGVHPNVW